MLNVELDEETGIAILEPDGKLAASDFESASAIIDPFIEQSGKLNGIVIHVESFPGWDSFSALVRHLRFVKDHHKKVSHVAFATDSPLGGFAEHVASHFVNAEIRHFSYAELDESKDWILGRDNE